jgi:hypothetical protein
MSSQNGGFDPTIDLEGPLCIPCVLQTILDLDLQGLGIEASNRAPEIGLVQGAYPCAAEEVFRQGPGGRHPHAKWMIRGSRPTTNCAAAE